MITFAQDDELAWLEAVLGGAGTGPSTTYLVRPSADAPQLLIPIAPRVVAAAAMRRHHDARSARERVQGLAGRLIARTGALRFTGGQILERPPFQMLNDLERALGEPRVMAAISLGPRRRNRKPVLQLIRPDGDPIGFAKVGWSDLTRDLVTNEGHWLTEVEGKLPSGIIAPGVLHRAGTDATDLVVTTPLHIDDRAGRSGPLDSALVLGLARSVGSRMTPIDRLAVVADGRDLIGDAIDIARLISRHEGVEVEAGLWHGDLTPWNTATRDGQTMLWDWEFAGDRRPVGLDLLHTRFEEVRRAAPGNEVAALTAVEAEARTLLAPALGANNDSTIVAAVLDVYLCELVMRETRLAGEGWRPEHLGDLAGPAAATIQRRLDHI